MNLAPLITPTAQLSPQEHQRYTRHFNLPGIGIKGQERLAQAKVLTIGAGGLGSPTLLYLAAAGIGTLGIIDHDTVETSNLQRQIIHPQASLGTPKVSSAANTLHAQNPHLTIHQHPHQLTTHNALETLSNYDLIIDGSDNFATRYITNDACEHLGKPLIWGTISQYTAQVSLFWANPTTTDGTTPAGTTLRDLYPDIPPADSVPTCATGGVLGSLCGTTGSVMATEAIKLITGTPETLLGKLWMYDARTHTTKTLNITREPNRKPTPLTQTHQEIQEANQPTPNTTPHISTHQYRTNPTHYTLLDVREPHERAQGHYPDIGNIPHTQLLHHIEQATHPKDLPQPLAHHTHKNLLIYCAKGTRSTQVVQALTQKFPTITAHTLTGGYQPLE